MRKGVLVPQRETERLDIRFSPTEYYGSLHCGETLEVQMNEKWIPTRIEMGRMCYIIGPSHRAPVQGEYDDLVQTSIRKGGGYKRRWEHPLLLFQFDTSNFLPATQDQDTGRVCHTVRYLFSLRSWS